MPAAPLAWGLASHSQDTLLHREKLMVWDDYHFTRGETEVPRGPEVATAWFTSQTLI